MDKNEALQVIRSNYPTDRNQLCEALETLIPELKESEYGKPCGGIVLEDFNGGEGFYKVNLAYLNKEQVIEIEELVKKWNPKLKEGEDEWIRKSIIGFLKTLASLKDGKTVSNEDFNSETLLEWATWLEKQGEQKPANYSVWVGGSEVNDNYLTKEEAEKLAGKYRKDGYEDVVIEKIEQKPTWSENDELNFNQAIYVYHQHGYLGVETWLKSLKERIKV